MNVLTKITKLKNASLRKTTLNYIKKQRKLLYSLLKKRQDLLYSSQKKVLEVFAQGLPTRNKNEITLFKKEKETCIKNLSICFEIQFSFHYSN